MLAVKSSLTMKSIPPMLQPTACGLVDPAEGSIAKKYGRNGTTRAFRPYRTKRNSLRASDDLWITTQPFTVIINSFRSTALCAIDRRHRAKPEPFSHPPFNLGGARSSVRPPTTVGETRIEVGIKRRRLATKARVVADVVGLAKFHGKHSGPGIGNSGYWQETTAVRND